MAIPQQSEVDFNDPEQRLAWAFRNMEYNGFPLAVPDKVVKAWSRHLSECGFIHVSEITHLLDPDVLPNKQTIHFQPPVRGQDHTMNTSGRWVPVEQEIVEPLVPASSLMTPAEKAKMIAEFKEEGLID